MVCRAETFTLKPITDKVRVQVKLPESIIASSRSEELRIYPKELRSKELQPIMQLDIDRQDKVADVHWVRIFAYTYPTPPNSLRTARWWVVRGGSIDSTVI